MSSYSTLARTAADQTLRGFLRMVCIHGDMVLGNTHISVHPIISTFSSLTFQVSRAAGLAKKSRGAGTNSGLSGLRRATRTDPVTMSSPSRVTPKFCLVSWAQERLVWCYLPVLKNVKHQRKLAK